MKNKAIWIRFFVELLIFIQILLIIAGAWLFAGGKYWSGTFNIVVNAIFLTLNIGTVKRLTKVISDYNALEAPTNEARTEKN